MLPNRLSKSPKPEAASCLQALFRALLNPTWGWDTPGPTYFQEPNQTTSLLANHPKQEASSFLHSVSYLKESLMIHAHGCSGGPQSPKTARAVEEGGSLCLSTPQSHQVRLRGVTPTCPHLAANRVAPTILGCSLQTVSHPSDS